MQKKNCLEANIVQAQSLYMYSFIIIHHSTAVSLAKLSRLAAIGYAIYFLVAAALLLLSLFASGVTRMAEIRELRVTVENEEKYEKWINMTNLSQCRASMAATGPLKTSGLSAPSRSLRLSFITEYRIDFGGPTEWEVTRALQAN